MIIRGVEVGMVVEVFWEVNSARARDSDKARAEELFHLSSWT
jgi:hypothetical protein